jgi:hypothetical protein
MQFCIRYLKDLSFDGSESRTEEQIYKIIYFLLDNFPAHPPFFKYSLENSPLHDLPDI